ncbi:MAG: response regulator transcription factor [bacterium]
MHTSLLDYSLAIWHTQEPTSLFIQEFLKNNTLTGLIVLTQGCDDAMRIEALKSGADDIIDYSISDEELRLRIMAIAKRVSKTVNENFILRIGNYVFDYRRRTLSLGNETRTLTTKEAELLNILGNSVNIPVSKHDALTRIWGEDSYHNGRSMDVYIGKLRKYLQKDSNIHIMNVHGMGYTLSILT